MEVIPSKPFNLILYFMALFKQNLSDVLLTVHLSIIVVIIQLNSQSLLNWQTNTCILLIFYLLKLL